jgi:hypothetical protein
LLLDWDRECHPVWPKVVLTKEGEKEVEEREGREGKREKRERDLQTQQHRSSFLQNDQSFLFPS